MNEVSMIHSKIIEKFEQQVKPTKVFQVDKKMTDAMEIFAKQLS